MGTRSTTKIYNDGKLILALYKQYDGYPEAWGKELKQFINSGVWVNGISDTKSTKKGGKIFNGIGDFALQLVCEFKKEAGGLYATTEDDEESYNYKIEYKTEGKINFSMNKATLTISCNEEPKFNKVIKLKVK